MFLVLMTVSLAIFIIAFIGNTLLLKYSIYRYKRNSCPSNIIFCCLCICNDLCCILGIPLHIFKIYFDEHFITTLSSYSCFLRYLATMLTNEMSLFTLTALIITRKDKIVRQPFRLSSTFTKTNVNKFMLFGASVITFPNIGLFMFYLYYYIQYGVDPCENESDHSNSILIINILCGVKTTIITTPCIVIILQAASTIYKSIQIRQDKRSTRTIATIKKVKACFRYTSLFMIFWLPYVIITFTLGQISPQLYCNALNGCYTFVYCYLAFFPIAYALSDKYFTMHYLSGKRFLSNYQYQMSPQRQSLESSSNM